jgi:iron complex outermembrane receptor protein
MIHGETGHVSAGATIANQQLQQCFVIRGFFTCNYYLDGVRVNSFFTPPQRDMANIQQVEVLKGPASILYGRLEPGGLIELDPKQPQIAPYYSLEQQIGSYGFYRTVMDMTGPVTPDNDLLYRFVGAYENSGSFRDLEHFDHVFLAPRLHWTPTQDTQVNFYLEYLHDNSPKDRSGTLLLNNHPAPAPVSRNLGAPDSQLKTNYDIRVGFNWTHAFNPNWSLTQRFDADFRDLFNFSVIPLAPDCAIPFCRVPRVISAFPYENIQDYYTSLELTGHFDTFGLSHTLLAGGDYTLNHTSVTHAFIGSDKVPPTLLFNPVPTGDLVYLLANPDSFSYNASGEDWYGLYLQDQVTLPYDLHLLAGFRYDNAGTSSDDLNTIPQPGAAAGAGFRSNAIKPRVGLLWQPIPQLSLYGNYVENFGIANSTNPNQAPLPPTLARQWEAGMKADFLDNRLSATVAWFDIVMTNVATPDPNPILAADGYQVVTGAVRNTGIEFDIQGQLTPEVKIIGSYANIDSKIIADNGGQIGDRLFGVPRNSGSLWVVYSPLAEPVKGLALGAGFRAQSNVAGDNPNTYTLPGYATVNLMARYAFTFQQTKLTFQLNVNNLLDTVYFQTGGGSTSVFPGTPRTILGSIKAEF